MRTKMLIVAIVTVLMTVGTVQAITVSTVPVGDTGNVADATGYGAVSYAYNMGKFEVTASQYAQFLNAVAKADAYGLYNPGMADIGSALGCNIVQLGSSGNYTYVVGNPASSNPLYADGGNWANRPVNWVSWGDAARFANWLHNGQPTGDQNATTTEDGAYCVNGATSDAALMAVTRKAGAKWAIPTEDEWYKAAYYKGGSTDAGYWKYSTASDNNPSNVLVNPDPGNNANFYHENHTLTSPYFRTQVGAFANSDSAYGTFDQGGNVFEWNEANPGEYRLPNGETTSGPCRGRRGGSFAYTYSGEASALDAGTRALGRLPSYEFTDLGFRVVQVPEPATLSLLALGGLAVLRRRRLRR